MLQSRGYFSFQLAMRWLWLSCSLVLVWVLFIHQNSHSPTVNIVVATTLGQDYSWSYKVKIPNAKVIPFVADDPTAPFHPPVNKGREAMVYLTYLYQFYDALPDVSIFVHSEDHSWHTDSIFQTSIAYTLNHLDLEEVMRRRYLNLHIDWRNGCPAWINTTNTDTSMAKHKYEQPYMKNAFLENFPHDDLPEILAQPCCSQFAVTREAIHTIPREQYRQQINWLMTTNLDDKLSGRLWEHMWQFLFLKKAVDCPEEYKALCRGWHICFKSQKQLEQWNDIAIRRESFHPTLGRIEPPKEILDGLDAELRTLKSIAIRRGRSAAARNRISGKF